jgi:hypothetical protein
MNSIRSIQVSALLICSPLLVTAEICTNNPTAPFTNRPAAEFSLTNRILMASNSLPPLVWQDVTEVSSLPAGVYLTRPYTCMVKVPGGHPDDTCLHDQFKPTEPMPVLRPDLKTVPLGP